MRGRPTHARSMVTSQQLPVVELLRPTPGSSQFFPIQTVSGRPYEDTGVVAGDVAIEPKGVEHPDDHDDDKPGLGVLVGGVSTTVVGLAVKKRTLW